MVFITPLVSRVQLVEPAHRLERHGRERNSSGNTKFGGHQALDQGELPHGWTKISPRHVETVDQVARTYFHDASRANQFHGLWCHFHRGKSLRLHETGGISLQRKRMVMCRIRIWTAYSHQGILLSRHRLCDLEDLSIIRFNEVFGVTADPVAESAADAATG